MFQPFASIRRYEYLRSNIFWAYIAQGSEVFFLFFLSIVFIRFGALELYGRFLLVIATTELLSLISMPGVRTVVLKNAAQGYEGIYRSATKFTFVWSILGIPLVAAVGMSFLLWKDPVTGNAMLATALFFPFLTSLKIWAPFLKGKSLFRKLAIYTGVSVLTRTLLIFLALLLHQPLLVLVLLYAGVTSAFNILYTALSAHSLNGQKPSYDWRRQSYALTIMDVSSLISSRADILIMGVFASPSIVTLYGLVMKFGALFLQLIRTTLEPFLPRIYRQASLRARTISAPLILSIVMPFILLPVIQYPVLFFYGKTYASIVPFIQVYLLALPFYFLFLITAHLMIRNNMNAAINFTKITSIILVLFLYLTFIPQYGIWGGIFSSIAYFAFEGALNVFFLARRRRKM